MLIPIIKCLKLDVLYGYEVDLRRHGLRDRENVKGFATTIKLGFNYKRTLWDCGNMFVITVNIYVVKLTFDTKKSGVKFDGLN